MILLDSLLPNRLLRSPEQGADQSETTIKLSAAMDGSFGSSFAYKSLDIHKVFLHFYHKI